MNEISDRAYTLVWELKIVICQITKINQLFQFCIRAAWRYKLYLDCIHECFQQVTTVQAAGTLAIKD